MGEEKNHSFIHFTFHLCVWKSFLPCTMWHSGIKLGCSGLAASDFTHQTNSWPLRFLSLSLASTVSPSQGHWHIHFFSSSCVPGTQTWDVLNKVWISEEMAGWAGACVLFPARSSFKSLAALRKIDLHRCTYSPLIWGISYQRNKSKNSVSHYLLVVASLPPVIPYPPLVPVMLWVFY